MYFFPTTHSYLLFRWIVQLVFIGPAEALLDSTVHPQALHGTKQLLAKRLCVLHACYHIKHHFGVRLQRKMFISFKNDKFMHINFCGNHLPYTHGRAWGRLMLEFCIRHMIGKHQTDQCPSPVVVNYRGRSLKCSTASERGLIVSSVKILLSRGRHDNF